MRGLGSDLPLINWLVAYGTPLVMAWSWPSACRCSLHFA